MPIYYILKITVEPEIAALAQADMQLIIILGFEPEAQGHDLSMAILGIF